MCSISIVCGMKAIFPFLIPNSARFVNAPPAPEMIDGISMAMLYESLQRRFTFRLNGRKSKAALKGDG